jgi:hypothetical protein
LVSSDKEKLELELSGELMPMFIAIVITIIKNNEKNT